VYVDIAVPDLPSMIETGQLPQHLVDAAIGVASRDRPTPTKELIVQEREFTDVLVQKMVVNPKLSMEDVAELPYEDKELLVAIATRRTDLDALGHQLGGLHKIDDYRKFRGLGSFIEDVEDAFGS
jgi:hypothetical protein